MFDFEFHLTAQVDSHRLSIFEALCRHLGGKAIVIELPQGDFCHQPMLSVVIKLANKQMALQKANELSQYFANNNFTIIRHKIEINSRDYDRFYQSHDKSSSDNLYFEWHGKVLFHHDDELDFIKKIAKQINAHLSKNSLKNSIDTRFLTYRDYGDINGFDKQVLLIKKVLSDNNITLIKSQSEYCIFDDKLTLDTGWIV